MLNRYAGIAILTLGLLPVNSGCGFDALELSTDLRLSFNVDGDNGVFDKEQSYKPDDNEDIRQNREKLAESVIRIREITVDINRVSDETEANFAWGKVYAFPANKPLEQADIEKDQVLGCEESLLSTACFEAIPLVATEGIHLDMTPAQKAKLVDLVFNHPELAIKLIGWTDRETSPTVFQADVVFSIEATASLF